MSARHWLALGSLCCLGAGIDRPTPAAAQRAAAATAIVDVAVIPMDRERVLPRQTVVVQGERITALGPTSKVRVPAGAVRIDGRGKYLIPGLADMHSHGAGLGNDSAETERSLFLYAANGVTTIRFALGIPAHLAFRARAARGELVSPRIYVARDLANDDNPDVAQAMADIKTAGYDSYGEYVSLAPGPRLDTLSAAAHRVGLSIGAHTPPYSEGGLERAVQVGYRLIEHLTGWAEYLTAGQSSDRDFVSHPLDATKLRTMAARMHQDTIFNVPTLLMFDLGLDSAAGWSEFRYLPDSLRRQTIKELAPSGQDPARRKFLARQGEAIGRVLRALEDAGAGILVGTDNAADLLLPGFSVHRELQVLVQLGLTPYEALAAGTRNVAAYLGTQDSTGTVAVGKRADLVLLTGNPLQDIHHTMQPAGVLLGGHWLSRTELDARLATFEGGWRQASQPRHTSP